MSRRVERATRGGTWDDPPELPPSSPRDPGLDDLRAQARHSPTGNGRGAAAYHDKRFAVRAALRNFETAIFLDADSRLDGSGMKVEGRRANEPRDDERLTLTNS